MAYLFVAFIVVPVVEIFLITQVASQISWLPTIALVIGVSLVGAFLVRREGVSVIQRVRQGFSELRMPTNELADGAMIFFASALMLTPGFLTDALGLALLIPPIRALIRPSVISYFGRRIEVRTQGIGGPRSPGFGRPGSDGPTGSWPGGRRVYDATSSRPPADADLTDITDPPESPPELPR